jgi:hypothetical protein
MSLFVGSRIFQLGWAASDLGAVYEQFKRTPMLL